MESDYDVMNCRCPIALRIGPAVQYVPCGKCNFCLASRRADWSFRLFQELKVSKSANFLTLTYDESSQPFKSGDCVVRGSGVLLHDGVVGSHGTWFRPSLYKKDVQLFTKRFRKSSEKELVLLGESGIDTSQWPSVRYYTVGEYGSTTFRPHYHSIIFNVAPKTMERVTAHWSMGHCKVGSVSAASIHYVTKYVINRVGDWEGVEPPFSLISNRSGGLGSSYILKHRDWHKGDVMRPYVMQDGFKLPMPRLFKDKIFSAGEKERMARECMAQLGVEERKEIERLVQFHPDPHGYFLERIEQAYNCVNVDKSINPNEV